MRKGILKFTGTFCGSCTYAIEKAGRKVEGVDDVRVDPSTGLIHVEYSGGDKSLERVLEIVDLLGHGATLVTRDEGGAPHGT